MSARSWIFSLFISTACWAGCNTPAENSTAEPAGGSNASAPSPSAPAAVFHSIDELHAALKAKNPNYNGRASAELREGSVVAVDLKETGVVDVSPLAGQPLQMFFAENNALEDLKPLKGMRIISISLSDTPVADLSPLRGMPLREVRLVNTKVADIGPLQGAPLKELWLNNSPVSDISSLAGSPLVSLTIEGTKVRDIGVVRQLPLLERLNMAGAAATDLSPVAGLRLTRLIFTPSRITKGLDAARDLPLCREIGPSLEAMGPPAQFWPALEAGAFK